jgi:hypothetical protein
MSNVPEENAPFVSDRTADSSEQKENLLREFLENDWFEEINGVQVNRNKFLYLYGEENTAQLSILKTVAREVFGDTWESKIYVREDMGQRYPYKLHAHKVESSKRVVFITHSKLSWAKWKELYPNLRTFTFLGAEIEPNSNGLVSVHYPTYFSENQTRKEEFGKDIRDILKQVCETMNVAENIQTALKEKVMSRIRHDWVMQHTAFVNSEVP